ncbi:MAG: hypothetical protein U0Y68_09565 [Blastocatellia bacterium]
MGKIVAEMLMLLALPAASFYGGVWLMTKLSNHQLVLQEMQKIAQPPLYQRLGGYSLQEVKQCWEAFSPEALLAEERFLQLDLVFPFVYGGALTISLLLAWALLGRPFRPVWLLTPVVITMLADWTENLTQLGQLRLFTMKRGGALQANWIWLASLATTVKLLFFTLTAVGLLALVVLLFFRPSKAI